MKDERVSRHWSLRVLKAVAIAVVAVPLFGGLVMLLWNWLVPPIFGWNTVSFWEALGLFLLARILMGGPHGHGQHPVWRERLARRWERMTPEEREKLREALRARCGSPEPRQSESHT
jgi:hypothetical protein